MKSIFQNTREAPYKYVYILLVMVICAIILVTVHRPNSVQMLLPSKSIITDWTSYITITSSLAFTWTNFTGLLPLAI